MKRKTAILHLVAWVTFLTIFHSNSIAQQDNCAANALFDTPAENVFMGATLQFENNSTGAISYIWEVDGEEMSHNAQYTHTFNTSGIVSVTLKAYAEGNVCYSYYTKKIKVTRNLGDRVGGVSNSFPAEVSGDDGEPTEHKVYDRFGNTYDLKDLEIPNHSVIAGIFMLHFYDDDNNTGTGFDGSQGATRRNAVTQVFKDLSALLMPTWNLLTPTPYTGTYYVEMDIRSNVTPSGNPMPAGALGVASQYYLDYGTGITHGEVWKTIKTGMNSYHGFTPQPSYHGYMAINFQSINWYTSLSSTAIGSNQFDLYTVALHEAIHALGFASLIGQNGAGLSGRYSIYDTYLKFGSVNLLGNLGSCYSQLFTSSLSNIIAGCSTLYFTGPNVTNEVYSPSVWAQGSSLSHFNCTTATTCTLAGNGYCMNYCSALGIVQRYPHCKERQALADLGYSVQSTYGNGAYSASTHTYSSCPATAVTVAGVNDYNRYNAANTNAPFTVASNGSSLTLIDWSTTTTPGILNNDNGASEFSCVEIIMGGSSSNLNVNYGTQTIVYTPPVNYFGTAILKYRPKHSSGKLGNITYIFIQVYAPCNSATCNQICYGDFENFNVGAGSLAFPPQFIDFKHTNTNSPDVCTDGSNKAGFIASVSTNREGILFKLKKPIPPGCIVKLNFKVSFIKLGSYTGNHGRFEIHGWQSPPCPLSSGDTSSYVCGNNTPQCTSYTPKCMAAINVFNQATLIPPITPTSHFYPSNFNLATYINWSYTNTVTPIEYIVLTCGNSIPVTSGSGFGIYIDDLEIYNMCSEQYTVTPTVLTNTPCPGGQASISYDICLQGGGSYNTDTLFLGVDTTFSTYLSHAGGGNFNNQGQAMILPGALTTLNPCTTVVANVNISPNAPPGLPIQVNLNVQNDSACIPSSANNPPVYIIPGPDSTLHISKIAPPGPHQAGDTIKYTILVCNSSLTTSVTNIYIRDTVPSQFVTSTINSSNMTVIGNIVKAGPFSLAPGDCDTFTFTAELDTGTCGWVTNCAYIDSAEGVCGYVDSGCTDIFVYSYSPAPVAGKDSAYCPSYPLDSMYAQGSAGCTLYWFRDSVGTITFIDTGKKVLPPYTAPGTYKYIVVDSCNGCPSLPDTVTIIIYAPPTIGPAGPFCVTDAPSQIPYSPPGGTFYPDVPGSVSATGVFDPSIAGVGIHGVGYVYTDPNTGCTERVNVLITVYGPPEIIVPTIPVCYGSPSFNLTASQPGGVWQGAAITNSAAGTFSPSLASIGANMVIYYIPGYVCADSIDTAYVQVLPNDWQQTAGAPSSPGVFEEGLDVKTDKDGNVYVTGSCDVNALFGTSTYLNGPGFLAKYDPCGALLWAVDLPNIGMALAIEDGAKVYVGGGGTVMAFLEAYDPGSGGLLFSSIMPHTGTYAHIRSMILNNNNEPYVTGTFSQGPLNFPGWGVLNPTMGNNTEAFIAWFNPGTQLWGNVQHIKSPIPNGFVEGNGITIKPGGGKMYVVGNYENYADFGGIFENQKGYNSYLVRYDPALTPITSRTVTWAVPNAVEVEYRDYYTTGEAIILGYSNIASFWSVSMLNNWTTTAPATESYYDIHLDRIDDKLYVTGADFSTLSTVVVREVDPSNGSLGWAEYSSYGTGNAKDYGKGVAALDGEDFVFATGSYTGNIIFGSTTSHWSSSGGSSDDIFTCRVHKGTAAFAKNDPGTPVIPKSDEALPAISVYPNPSTGEFTIRFGNADGEGTASLEISSVTGQILISKQYSLFKGLNKLTLNASNLSSGIYFISVKYNDYSVTKKVMISKD